MFLKHDFKHFLSVSHVILCVLFFKGNFDFEINYAQSKYRINTDFVIFPPPSIDF